MFSPASVKKRVAAHFAIGLRHVQLVVYEEYQPGRARVDFCQALNLPRYEQKNAKQVRSAVASGVFKLLEKYREPKKGLNLKDPELLAFYIAPPLAVSGTEPVIIRKKTVALLTEKDLQSAIEHAEQSFLARTKKNEEAMPPEDQIVIIERELHSAMLDGYPVDSYLLRSCKEFSATLTVAETDNTLIEKLNDVCRPLFPQTVFSFKALELNLLDGIDTEKNYLLCFLLPHGSHWVHVQQGFPVGFYFDQFGSEKIAAVVAHSLKGTQTVAQSYVRLYVEKKLHGNSESRFIKAVESAGAEYLKAIESVRGEFGNGFLLPKCLYIIPSDEIDLLVSLKLPASGSDQYGQYQLSVIDGKDKIAIESSEPSCAIGSTALLINRTLNHRNSA